MVPMEEKTPEQVADDLKDKASELCDLCKSYGGSMVVCLSVPDLMERNDQMRTVRAGSTPEQLGLALVMQKAIYNDIQIGDPE